MSKCNWLFLLLFSLLCACSKQQLYDATQPKYSDTECANQQLPKSEFEACIARQGMSYEEYERERGASDQDGR